MESVKDSVVIEVTAQTVAAVSVSIGNKPTDNAAAIGDTFTLSYALAPDGASGAVERGSSNSAVATIDKDGNVSAVGEGFTVISVALKDGPSVRNEFTLTVGDMSGTTVESISIVPSSLQLRQGMSQKLSYTYLPADSVWFEVEWTSAGESVTVTEQGVVTAVSVGGGTVTATVKGTSIAAQCAVTVVAPLDPLCEDFD